MKKIKKMWLLLTILAGVCLLGCAIVNGNNEKDEKEIIIDSYTGEASYNKQTKTISFPGQWKNFILDPPRTAKGKYICVEYSNLKGGINLYVHYDDGDNDFDSENNPCSEKQLLAYKNKIYLELEASKFISSKTVRLKFLSTTNTAEFVINKIYFTDEVIDKQPVVDNRANPVDFNNSISAINLVKEMAVGFNLGNCYEAHQSMNDTIEIRWDGVDYWKSPEMSAEVLEDLAQFFGKNSSGKSNAKTIRIPVTWFNHIIDDNYTIDPYWMEQIKNVVDIAYGLGYYVIINSHHDVRGLDKNPPMSTPLKYHEGYILRDTPEDISESKQFLENIWKQICAAFNNSYGERLIFETMNEPRNTADKDGFWGVNKDCSDCLAEAKLNNEYNQLILNTIRASGGNNAKRFVMIPNVACDRQSGLDEVFKMPEDSATDKLILTIHWYPLWDHLWMSEGHDYDLPVMQNIVASLNSNFVEKGIPIVIGEIGPTEGDFGKLAENAGKTTEEEINKEALKPLYELVTNAGQYGMSALIFHLNDLQRKIDGKYLPQYLVEAWNQQ